MSELTEHEQEVVAALEEYSPCGRDVLVENTSVEYGYEMSDILRSLRYKGIVEFSFDDGFCLV